MFPVSVIICTHNPRKDYLSRVLAGLRHQTLAADCWELLVIDNASTEPLDSRLDLTWHPHSRIVREDELGATPARLRGIRESAGDLLVLVDDDNVLDADYLSQALTVARDFPQMGAWCGSVRGEFETPVPDWYRPHLDRIAVGELSRDCWSNCDPPPVIPWGAGMCFRRSVAQEYLRQCSEDPRHLALGRRGSSLISGEDNDIAMCAMDVGYGLGRFARLRLTHLIPRERLTKEYLLNLAVAEIYAAELLFRLRNPPRQQSHPFVSRFIDWLRAIRLKGVAREIALVRWKARIAVERKLRRGG
jgi:glycosyltransferase involved in cell wall biosynthesis